MRHLKIIHLFIIGLSLTLTACGGGGSGSGVGNGSADTAEVTPAQQPANLDPMKLFTADEKSEPVDMSNIDMSSLSGDDIEDDETMNAMVSLKTGTSKP